MKTHFCRVGKIKPNLNKLISLNKLENRIANLVEDKTKIDYSEDLNGAI
ncbi:hypothetical protein GCM10007028_12970 [Algibacter mikhailovii]|uniref:Uncharacterized protein n=1 Tax=Algibacter mikhailovii TaxID=425498 RepID=A0A918V932_9FLAO|nr:hypothetical protein GCM10007028_12970 [Algibacter mikhailovii]